MKKLIMSAASLALAAAISVSAFAAGGFNTAVFDTGKDITVETDSMTGTTTVFTTSLLEGDGGTISTGWDEEVLVYGGTVVGDDLQLYSIAMAYYADDWAFINKVIMKIGDTRYTFTEIDNSKKVFSNATIRELVTIPVKTATIPFMQDLIEHRDEEVRVRLCGSEKDVEFVLTDAIKDSLINLYNLFVAGGGTRESNMKTLDMADRTVVRVARNS